MMQLVGDIPKLRLKNELRKFDRVRKNKMAHSANMLLSALGNKRHCQSQLLPVSEVKDIVIVRSNDRVGNTVFLIPFIRQVQQIYPHAKITLLLNKPWQQQMFEHLGIDHFEFARLSKSSLLPCLSSLRKLRGKVFDLCLSPSVSAQSSVLSALLSARNKISYSSKYHHAFTHTYPRRHHHNHAALCNLSLLAQVHHSNVASRQAFSHQLAISADECQQGREAKEQLTTEQGLLVAFFRGARGDKKLSESLWVQILNQIELSTDQPVNWVEIMGPEIEAPLFADSLTYRSNSLRELACFLRHSDGFVSCDTGPLHLADAAGAKCIGLYTHTDPSVYGLLGEHCLQLTDTEQLDRAAIARCLEAK